MEQSATPTGLLAVALHEFLQAPNHYVSIPKNSALKGNHALSHAMCSFFTWLHCPKEACWGHVNLQAAEQMRILYHALSLSKQRAAEAKGLTDCWEECHCSRRFHMLSGKTLHLSSTCNSDESLCTGTGSSCSQSVSSEKHQHRFSAEVTCATHGSLHFPN